MDKDRDIGVGGRQKQLFHLILIELDTSQSKGADFSLIVSSIKFHWYKSLQKGL